MNRNGLHTNGTAPAPHRYPVSLVTLSMGLSSFLVVVLALTLQQTHRMSTEIERLHWQLSLAQLSRTNDPSGPHQNIAHGEILARIEESLKGQEMKLSAAQLPESSAMGKPLSEAENKTEKDAAQDAVIPSVIMEPLQPECTASSDLPNSEIQTEMENSLLENAEQSVVREIPQPQCFIPSEEGSSDSQEDEAATLPSSARKRFAGIMMISIVAVVILTYRNLDCLQNMLPTALSRRLDHVTQGLPLSKILEYRMDYWFSTNPHSKAVALMTVTIVLVAFGGIAIYVVSETPLYNAIWEALAGVGIDWTFSDQATSGTGLGGVAARVVATIVSLGGLLVTALMLGIVSEAISEKVDEMKKGVSKVLEHDHTLILGWSDKLIPVISQICLANESIGGEPIVIMAMREKEDMEAEITHANLNLRGSRVICRSGNPLLRHDLAKVSVHLARSIIVLANHQSPDQSDATVLRIVLSLVALHDQYKESGGLKGHIVAEMCDMDNEPLVKLVGCDKVETVVAHDIIGRLMIQCARQPGLAGVWAELMGYEGCEFYLNKWPEIEGKTFGEILLSFPDAIPLGKCSVYDEQGNQVYIWQKWRGMWIEQSDVKHVCCVGVRGLDSKHVILNPDDSYVFQQGDELLVLAEDDDTYKPCEPKEAELVKRMSLQECPKWQICTKPERILFCGWRRDMDDMIVVMDDFVSPGSELWLYNEVPINERHELLVKGGLNPEVDLKNIKLFYKDERLMGDLVTRKKLENLDPSSFSSILILADESATGQFIADADSRNLATLLLLRDIMFKKDQPEIPEAGCILHQGHGPSLEFFQSARKAANSTVIISEILDSRTRNLIQELNISEFVMSNELVSMVLAMVSESAEVNTVLKELFTDLGNELYVYPAEKYIREGEVLSFYDLTLRARGKSEICVGYKTQGGVVLNPPTKSENRLTINNIEAVVALADSYQS